MFLVYFYWEKKMIQALFNISHNSNRTFQPDGPHHTLTAPDITSASVHNGHQKEERNTHSATHTLIKSLYLFTVYILKLKIIFFFFTPFTHFSRQPD